MTMVKGNRLDDVGVERVFAGQLSPLAIWL
jgi:hypothetical protein